jgi:hypothetical protein
MSRSVAGTTIGTGAGFLLLSLWPVAVSNSVDAGQGLLVVFLLVPLIPVVLAQAWAGAKLAGNSRTPRQGTPHGRARVARSITRAARRVFERGITPIATPQGRQLNLSPSPATT